MSYMIYYSEFTIVLKRGEFDAYATNASDG
jgi:hypothetical protein